MIDDEEEDEWKILTPGILLFETTIGSLGKPVPHPVLDDSTKMMRIIANPVYDRLTFSRAAHLRNEVPSKCGRSSRLSNKSTEKTTIIPLKADRLEYADPKSIVNNQHPSKQHVSQPVRLPTASSTRKSPSNQPSKPQSRVSTAHSTSQSTQSALIDSNTNTKQSLTDGTIRYVNSHYGFEVQRYASSNWLTTDIFAKDACQSHEQTFRQMLDKKRQYERLSRSIYSSEYYKKRWNELVQSYKQGHLTHEEWATQNYQLLCLRTLYNQAKEREQRDVELDAQDVRRDRAHSAYQQWKELKAGESLKRQKSRVNTAHSQRTHEGNSFLSTTNSFSTPLSIIIDENNTNLVDATVQGISSSSITDSDAQQISNSQPKILSKNLSATEKALYMLDEQRWSLQAMLKRVVGLAEPLPPPPKILPRKQSLVTNTSVDSGFESVH